MKTVLPEINFLNTDPKQISDEVISTYEQLEGRTLADADPLRIIFLAMASVIAKLNVNINDAAKQNLLYYSRDDVLDHKGDAWRTPRLGNKPATSVIRLHMSQTLSNARIIKKGTLLTTDEATLIFETTEEGVVQPQQSYIDINIQCTSMGVAGNGLGVGEINTLIVPLPYIEKVENITVSAGGVEAEDDDNYKGRIRQAPETLSTAGPEGAYEYFVKSANSSIGDTFVDSTSPGVVDIRILLKNGELPQEEILDDVRGILSKRNVRPLTDNVSVGIPELITYDLALTYFIETNSVDKSLIHDAVEKAIEDYILWQSCKIGRDINPSKLISDCIKAGAKRVEVTSPIFTPITGAKVARIGTKTVNFGGLEDD